MPVVKACEQCGKQFSSKPSKRRRFCSQECFRASQTRGIERQCKNCGTIFKTWFSEVRKGGANYCSRKCGGLSRRRRVKRECKVCGKEFEALVSKDRWGKGRYCSHSCVTTHTWNGKSHKKVPGSEELKSKAHHTLNLAVRRGVLVRPSQCAYCGEQKPVVGHHDDYTKPLNVIWLCRKCHLQRHRELQEQTHGTKCL